MRNLAIAALLLSSTAVLAQTPPVSDHVETVYSDSQLEKDQSISRETVQSVLAPVDTTEDQYARWKQPVCFNVYGLSATAKFVVEHRLKEIATQVGAPVDRRDPCAPTVTIAFTPDQRATLESIAKVRPWLVPGLGMIRSAVRESQPIQAWYATTAQNDNGMGVLVYNGYDEEPLWRSSNTVSRISTGVATSMAAVVITVDTKAIMGMSLGTLADHIALLSLAQARAARHCSDIETIANLMQKDSEAGLHTNAITNNDLALLTGLYRTPDDYMQRLQKQRIIGNMRRTLEARARQ